MTLALWQGTAQAISVNLVPSTQNAFLGNSIDVAVTISDLGNGIAPSLSTYDLDISFNSNILDFSSATFGDPVLGNQLDLSGFGTDTEIKEPSLGVINIFELSLSFPDDLNNLQADSFTLATLTFDTIAIGTSPLNISIVDLGDAFGEPLTGEEGSSSVTVSSKPINVPEPSFTLLSFCLTIFFGALLNNSRRDKESRKTSVRGRTIEIDQKLFS